MSLYLPSNQYSDFIMSTMASQITSLTIIYSSVYWGTDQRKHQSSASLAFVRGIEFPAQMASNAIWWRHHVYDDRLRIDWKWAKIITTCSILQLGTHIYVQPYQIYPITYHKHNKSRNMGVMFRFTSDLQEDGINIQPDLWMNDDS